MERFIPESPTPAEIELKLIQCDYALEALERKIAHSKNEQRALKWEYNRALAKALVLCRDAGNATLVKATADLDPDVESWGQKLLEAEAMLTLLQGEKETFGNHFITLRKLADLTKAQIERIGR
jgi:hypothetical protein